MVARLPVEGHRWEQSLNGWAYRHRSKEGPPAEIVLPLRPWYIGIPATFLQGYGREVVHCFPTKEELAPVVVAEEELVLVLIQMCGELIVMRSQPVLFAPIPAFLPVIQTG